MTSSRFPHEEPHLKETQLTKSLVVFYKDDGSMEFFRTSPSVLTGNPLHTRVAWFTPEETEAIIKWAQYEEREPEGDV